MARPLTGSGDKPDENRFTKVVLAEKLNEPLEMAILPDERVLLIEPHGAVPAQTSEQVLVLRNPLLTLGLSDRQSKGTMLYKIGQSPAVRSGYGSIVQLTTISPLRVLRAFFRQPCPNHVANF